MATKYIFVTGGVVSSVGKGITTASIGKLLKSRGISVVVQNRDPYLNVDPGPMSPYQPGPRLAPVVQRRWRQRR